MNARILAIVGPTASAKSAVALALAKERGGELVGCDSVQVYKGFDIGGAKPSLADQAAVPHHLIDVVEPGEPFDAQRYRMEARAAINSIKKRKHAPILCGGTGLYLRALRFGLVELPDASPTLRDELAAEERETPGSLYQRLKQLDPVTAQKTEPNNVVHVTRALEICLLTGEPASVVRARHGFLHEEVPLHVVALRWSHDALRERIIVRAECMVQDGLLDEVAGLLSRGVAPDVRPMRAVGYREALEVVQKRAPLAGLAERIAKSTWEYARRQRTWLRREPNVTLLDVASMQDALDQVRALSLAPVSETTAAHA